MTALCCAACGSGDPASDGADRAPGGEGAPARNDAPVPPAPWSAPPLAADEVPGVLLEAWHAAENRDRCALLAPASVDPAQATPRQARFAGGWGVAWDLPDRRSAFGVAGTGVSPSADTYDEWPHRLRWADGSGAGWGPEGGTGPNLLAYLEVEGEACLYNVWSRLGPEHMEALLGSLRRVDVPVPERSG